MNENVAGQVWANSESENIRMLIRIFPLVKKIWKLQIIDVSTRISDQSGHFYSICMNKDYSEKLLKNDVFEENLVKFENDVETKPLEPAAW